MSESAQSWIERVEESFSSRADRKASAAGRGMVATAFPEATRAGVEMLKKGGNAVDAACASSLALAVCEPQASGLGGQTIAMIHTGGKTIMIDGSSRAPSMVRLDLFQDETARRSGYKATTVPSTVATIGYLSERYGRLGWQTITEPAVRIARRGYRITQLQSGLQAANLAGFLGVESRSGARYFLKDGIEPYSAGDLFIQDDLADTLEHLGRFGYRSFYHGEIARRIDEDMRANGGLVRREDLALVPVPVERRPVSREYRGVRVCSAPPPGAGDSMLLVLMILARIPKSRLRTRDPETCRFILESFRRALIYRAARPLDPRTHHQISDGMHLGAGLTRGLADSIAGASGRIIRRKQRRADVEDTTHLSTMDDEGNAVSMTQSIELVYGSKAAAGGLGFLYNNYISAFEIKDPAHPFFLRPNSVPQSSACPSIVFSAGQPWIVVGSPGSSRIFSAVSLFISNIVDLEYSLYHAMASPRMHCSLEGRVSLEADDTLKGIAERMGEHGYEIDLRERLSFYMGAVHAVLRRRTGEGYQGVAEIRRDGTAEGID